MQQEPIDKFDHAGLTISIYQDWHASNPQREFDNLGTMVAFDQLGRNYDLADRTADWQEEEAHDRRLGLLERWMRMETGAEVVFFYLQDGGSNGARLYSTDEEGASGFFFVDGRDIVKEYGDDSPESREKARALLESEIKQMGLYVEGNVYGYVVSDEENDHIDSCWGFYGEYDDEYLIGEAKDAAEWIAHERALEDEPDLETAIKEATA